MKHPIIDQKVMTQKEKHSGKHFILKHKFEWGVLFCLFSRYQILPLIVKKKNIQNA